MWHILFSIFLKMGASDAPEPELPDNLGEDGALVRHIEQFEHLPAQFPTR